MAEKLNATPQQQREKMDEIIHDAQKNGKCELCKSITDMATASQTAGESIGIDWSKSAEQAVVKYVKFERTEASSSVKKKKVSECPKCGYKFKVEYGKEKSDE